MRTSDDIAGQGEAVHNQSGDGFARLVGGAALLTGDAKQACIDFCEQNAQIVMSCLPISLAVLAGGAGFTTMLDVVIVYGGRRVYLPTRENRFHAQSGIIVPAAAYAQWRSQSDGNGQIDVPSVWGLFLALRKAAILFALGKKWPSDEMHTTFGMSRRQLRSFRAEPGAPIG